MAGDLLLRVQAISLLLLLGLAACGTPFGIYHKVQPGQTLYRIAKTYNVPLEKIQRLNRIDDPRLLQPGDLVFVPGADRPREVPTMAAVDDPSQKVTAKKADNSSGNAATSSAKSMQSAKLSDAQKMPKPGLATTSKWDGGDAPRLIWPTRGQVSSGFGERNGNNHDGIDISAATGTPIYAAAAGRVIYSDDKLSGYGNLLIVRHEGSWATIYAHNDRNLAAKGDFVSQGQKIAEVGQTGRASGPHLHFEVRFGKTPKDPLKYLPLQ
jgi:lipoprotein NlpD